MTFALSALLQAVTDTAAAVPAAVPADGPGISRFTGLLGIAAIIAVGYFLSTARQAIKWRVVGIGLALQFLFALFVLRTDIGRDSFAWLGDFITGVLQYS